MNEITPEPAKTNRDEQRRPDIHPLAHLPLVRSLAAKVYRELPPGSCVDLKDLEQAGYIGLLSAMRSYEPSSGANFASYAACRVRGEIMDSLRRLDWLPRDARQFQKQTTEATRRLELLYGRQPTEEEVASHLGIAVQRLRERPVWLLEAMPDSSEIPDRQGACPETVCFGRELRRVLHKAISCLPDRYRTLLSLYYGRECTMREIGAVLRVNESRVSQMHKGALRAMAQSLREAGVSSVADLQPC